MTFANAKSLIKSITTKSPFTSSLLAAAAAGMLLIAAPAKSDAQVVFSAEFGGPVAVAPAYDPYYYNSYDAQRRAYIEHQEWLRAHRYYYDRDYYDRGRYDRDRYYDRDRRDHDRDRYDRDHDRDRR